MTKLIKLFLLLFSTLIFSQSKIEVYFNFNQSQLTPNTILKLDSLTTIKNIQINAITGFCDWVDTKKYNDSLSLKRANSVLEYLKIKNIIFSNNLKIIGKGKNFAQNTIQEKNRKVAINYSFTDINSFKKETKKNELLVAKKGEKIILKKLNFYNYSDILLPGSEPILNELLETLNENIKLKIEIQGHICCQTEEGKYDVSEARAFAIYKFLIKNGINKNRLSYKGFGSKLPIYKLPEKTEEERKTNRRVEIEIIETE